MTNREMPAPPLPNGVVLLHTLRGHDKYVGRIAWSRSGEMIVAPSADGVVRVWDVEKRAVRHTLRGHSGNVRGATFAGNDDLVITGGDDGTARVWSLADETATLLPIPSAELQSVFGSFRGTIVSVAADQSGHVVAGCGAGVLRILWEVPPARLVEQPEISSSVGGYCVAFSLDDLWIATSASSRETAILGRDGKEAGRLSTPAVPYSIAFHPNDRQLAVACSDGRIVIWNFEGGSIHFLEGHVDECTSVAFSPGGELLASKARDNTVKLWDTASWACVATIDEPASVAWPPGIAFHPRLPYLASVGSEPGTPKRDCDRVIHIWKLDIAKLLSRASSQIRHTSAKIVLVGESSVGKSWLAVRLAEGRPPASGEIASTHGMKLWTMAPENLGAITPEGEQREIILWDMGGQDEYRLVHELFLHDTVLALVLLDPRRGRTAIEDAEAWNKRLERQLRGRKATKLLVGSKVDEPSGMIDQSALQRLVKECGFADYIETSALNGRGIDTLSRAITAALDWEHLATTSRPELFQRIRDEIDVRRKRGEVVLHISDLLRSLSAHEASSAEEAAAVDAVTRQLAAQGAIALSHIATGEPVMILQIEAIERYAGSLILAARNNARGVPALELLAIARPDMSLPGMTQTDRLPRLHERAVLEATVQLLIEHGICFEHQGLLIFPTLFAPVAPSGSAEVSHSVALYYDFAGAIDNMYASLIAWLVLARNFGSVRLWPDRAEFDLGNGDLCGLRKVARAGGFAHVDVYFSESTPADRRELFVSFVEEHLRVQGVEIREAVTLKCHVCGHEFAEETLRMRIARGEKTVSCPVCETRHNLVEGAAEARQRNPDLVRQTWALKTDIDRRRERSVKDAVRAIVHADESTTPRKGARILHLSDLHFDRHTSVRPVLQSLLDDLRGNGGGLGLDAIDYLVISGDFTDRGSLDGFTKSYEFLSLLIKELALSAERCILVPGNHDVVDLREAYDWHSGSSAATNGRSADEYVTKGDIVLVRNAEKYLTRFKPFSDSLFHKLLQRPYPLDYPAQGIAIPFWETGIQFLTLNSCWQIDEFNRRRSGINPEALTTVVAAAQQQEAAARRSGELGRNQPIMRIAVWHHAVAGPLQIVNTDFLGHLQKNAVCLGLHGDVHEMRRDLIGYWQPQRLHVVGAGAFGAPSVARPESTPRLYNVLEIKPDLRSMRAFTRSQDRSDAPWKGWNEWPRPDGEPGGVPYYDITW